MPLLHLVALTYIDITHNYITQSIHTFVSIPQLAPEPQLECSLFLNLIHFLLSWPDLVKLFKPYDFTSAYSQQITFRLFTNN